MKVNKLYNSDCREGLKRLIEKGIKVDCVITSPPYWGLRNYGIPPSVWGGNPECEHDWDWNTKKGISGGKTAESSKSLYARKGTENYSIVPDTDYAFCSKCNAWKGTLGLEPNFDLFIEHLCNIYDLVWKVLAEHGTCWVNLGDAYGSGKGWDGLYDKHEQDVRNKPPIKGMQKCLLLLPQRFTIEMVNRGWILRNVIIWHKPNCMPSSAKDRFTVDFEYVYFFVKKKKYYLKFLKLRSSINKINMS